ncbi:MAG: hypothetical protein ACPGVG_00555 [Mycobacterium sp.]
MIVAAGVAIGAYLAITLWFAAAIRVDLHHRPNATPVLARLYGRRTLAALWLGTIWPLLLWFTYRDGARWGELRDLLLFRE